MNLCVVVPARNEAGHLEEVINQILITDGIDEVIIIEGGSSDNTWEEAIDLARKFPNMVRAIKQSSRGKFNAVLEGAIASNSEFVFIWDADGTVNQYDNQRIVSECLTTGMCIVGDRLRGEIHPGAMQKANFIANHFFALLWAPVLGFRKIDMLCGSKVFPKNVYLQIPKRLKSSDPYGDFALIITARLLNFKILSLNVDYFPRTYGETNISRWSGGVRLIVTSLIAFLLFARNKTFKR